MLESYITPLLMSYVDKYIKNLKPSDLSLSLWGGDVVLYNLELRLDVLEKVKKNTAFEKYFVRELLRRSQILTTCCATTETS